MLRHGIHTFALLILCLATVAPQFASAETSSWEDLPYEPLKPAETSSPRDTLRSFLSDYQIVLDEQFGKGRVTSNQGLAAYDRALTTLNFNDVPDGGSRWVQTERLAYLKEVLDKTPLPPADEIPDADEVRESGITEWSIPNTKISLSLTESGPYAGEWQFSPRTVQLLPRFYRQLREIPYQPGATEGLIEKFHASKDGLINRGRMLGNRLQSVNTSSPRSTLEGFLRNMNAAYELAIEVDEALGSDPQTITLDDARSLGRTAEDHLARAVATLNLSEVPEALRYDSGVEAALEIKEVLDRLSPAPIDQIPDLAAIREIRERNGGDYLPIRWVYPNTGIEIIEVTEGEDAGTFKFSPDTVANADKFFHDVKDLPYRDPFYNHFSAKYESAETSPGFYRFYSTTPGNLIPLTTTWGRIVDKLPAFFHREINEQSLWQWVASAIIYLLAIIVSIAIYAFSRKLSQHCRIPWNMWIRLIPPLLVSSVFLWVTHYITEEINITGGAILTLITFERFLKALLLSWGAFCFCRAIAETIIALPQIKDESIDASLLRLSSRIIGAMLGAWLIISALGELGLDIWPIIAGLGVGGLAVALAFRPTMENIIGSFMIFADKPYKVGQRVKVLDADGTVESIGLRSTKIRLLNGHLTTIPNEKMASVVIENIGQRPYIRRVFDITITYDTKPEKINRAVEIIREILAVPENNAEGDPSSESSAHPNEPINQPDFPPRVYFNNLNS
ncbi:MAG: mechanosensitive ion channel family protein, partial [Puniceicoccales bacterium]